MKEFMSRKRILVMVSLALFNFVFLGLEYFFDGMMALVTSSDGVVMAQNEILGVSVIGFVGYPLLEKRGFFRKKSIWALLGCGLVIVSSLVMYQHESYATVMIAGIITYVILGAYGCAVCFQTIHILDDVKNLAKTVGIAYALGILIQFLNGNYVTSQIIQVVLFNLGLIITSAILLATSGNANCHLKQKETQIQASPYKLKSKMKMTVALLLCVTFMTCIFSTLDNAVTMAHVNGTFDIGQWPRLLLAVSGIIAGVMYDIQNRKFMGIIMYIITMLSTACIVVLYFEIPFVAGLLIFYIAAGFFVVYFMTSFMDLASHMKLPKLWAGIGRAVNNLCALLSSAISVMLLKNGGIAILITGLALFALISICIAVYSYHISYAEQGLYGVEKTENNLTCEGVKNAENNLTGEGASNIGNNQTGEGVENAGNNLACDRVELDDEGNRVDESDGGNGGERLSQFCMAYGLTDREKEVLEVLVNSEQSVQDMAFTLGISRTAIYRHISNINEKTETKSRVGILQLYFGKEV